MRPLKFKQIRKSIIHNAQPSCSSPIKSPINRKLFSQIQPQIQMSFQSIKKSTTSQLRKNGGNDPYSTNKKRKFCFQDSSQRGNLSPLSNKKKNQIERPILRDSERKNLNFTHEAFNSDQKENKGHSIYFNSFKDQVNFTQAPLNFKPKQRKLNSARNNFDSSIKNGINSIKNDINQIKNDSNSKYLYETQKNPIPGSLTKKDSSTSMLFKSALQNSSKKSTIQGGLQSYRSTLRQNSIGKLKQRLFGMKKVISQKSPIPQPTNSFTIYTKKQTSIVNKTIIHDNDQMSFSNLVLESRKDVRRLNINQVLQATNEESRVEEVNISLAESRDDFLNMEPHL